MDRKLDSTTNIQKELKSLQEIFEMFDNPKDKFLQLMDMAKDQRPLHNKDKIESNKIYGCSSQAWVVAENHEDKTYTFRTDSDALIVKGLLQILEKIFNNQKSKEILSIDSQYILQTIGLEGSVTSQRNNGFSSAVNKIHKLVQ
tara:strand:- start:182 stop:613 length:432 start_codon:yes stop_codon:yes gene_type:complete